MLCSPCLQQCLRMVTTQPVGKGQEIFNTYGQMANWQLLHMYGFAEPYPGNTHDTADIQMVTLRRAALQREWHPSPSGRGWGRDLCSTGMTSKISLFHSISGDGAMPWFSASCFPFSIHFPFPSTAIPAVFTALLSSKQVPKVKLSGSWSQSSGTSCASWRWWGRKVPLCLAGMRC